MGCLSFGVSTCDFVERGEERSWRCRSKPGSGLLEGPLSRHLTLARFHREEARGFRQAVVKGQAQAVTYASAIDIEQALHGNVVGQEKGKQAGE
jgi:hypothetical protein